jgi:hypothetical protein
MEQGVPKRRHIKFRRRGITQKKAYNNLKYAYPRFTQDPQHNFSAPLHLVYSRSWTVSCKRGTSKPRRLQPIMLDSVFPLLTASWISVHNWHTTQPVPTITINHKGARSSPFFWSHFNHNQEVLINYSKEFQTWNFKKILPVESLCSIWAHGWK